MKRILPLALACLAFGYCTLTAAAVPGAYLGASAGYGVLETPSKFYFAPLPGGGTTRSRGGILGRAFAGVNLNPYFGLEIGYAKYRRSLYVGRQPVNVYSSIHYNSHIYDLEMKGYLPFGFTGANVYALAGIAHVVQTLNFRDGGIAINPALATPADGYTHTSKVRPIYGAGFNFSYCHFTVNVEYTQIMHLGNYARNANAIPYINYASVGLAYNFS